MRAVCECGEVTFQEFTLCVCPACGKKIEMIRCIDFEEYRSVLDKAFERIKQSIIKHGDWSDYSPVAVHKALSGEFNEYLAAVVADQISGRHGQIDELVDVIVTAVKGIRRLECLQ